MKLTRTEIQLLERMSRIETLESERHQSRKEAVALAQEIAEKTLTAFMGEVHGRFSEQNRWQERWDRNEEALARKTEVAIAIKGAEEKVWLKLSSLERILWIGVGLALAAPYVIRLMTECK